MVQTSLLKSNAGLAIVAMYAAAPALERIEAEKEEALVTAYASGATDEGSGSF